MTVALRAENGARRRNTLVQSLRRHGKWRVRCTRDGHVMSFRTRLTGFFALIVVVPMIAVGLLVFRLIDDSEQGKADARASGLASAASGIYDSQSAQARADARSLVGRVGILSGRGLSARLAAVAREAGLARIVVSNARGVIVDAGDRSAIAPGAAAVLTPPTRSMTTVTVSTLTAAQLAHDLTVRGGGVVIREGASVLASTLPVAPGDPLPGHGQLTLHGVSYRVVTGRYAGFRGSMIEIAVLSDPAASTTSLGTSRLVAIIFIVVFLALALAFSVMASRALQGQLSRFLEAARRLAGGDFSAPVPVEGHDEFAALGNEFNRMSTQLSTRLDELSRERGRLRELIRRIGHTFASNLDRPALLELALRTAVDAVEADRGRLSARQSAHDALEESGRVGDFRGLDDAVYDAERAALSTAGLGEARSDGVCVASVALGSIEPTSRTRGLITVTRERPFTEDDRELLRSLASQATLALENVELHFQVRRQAVTDEQTGLANHGRFQDLLSAEMEQVRRYHHAVGLIMLDIDDFKVVNDTYGHQQGDVVLRHVARAVLATSRETDSPARYGGEEMALILPHTDLEGSYAIAERLRNEIAALRIPRLNGDGVLRITASVGVAASSDGDKDTLIAEADRALYVAKREGKNRTVRAFPETANAFFGE